MENVSPLCAILKQCYIHVAAAIAPSIPLRLNDSKLPLVNLTAKWIGAQYFRPLEVDSNHFLSGYPAVRMVVIGHDIKTMAIAIDEGNKLYGVVYLTHQADYSKYLTEAEKSRH